MTTDRPFNLFDVWHQSPLGGLMNNYRGISLGVTFILLSICTRHVGAQETDRQACRISSQSATAQRGRADRSTQDRSLGRNTGHADRATFLFLWTFMLGGNGQPLHGHTQCLDSRSKFVARKSVRTQKS